MMFSVLLSVYKKEDAGWLAKALESILDQSVFPSEVVLVEDGPLTAELSEVISDYVLKIKNRGIRFQSVKLEKNEGLGIALQKGLEACSHPLVARMDGDDIAMGASGAKDCSDGHACFPTNAATSERLACGARNGLLVGRYQAVVRLSRTSQRLAAWRMSSRVICWMMSICMKARRQSPCST